MKLKIYYTLYVPGNRKYVNRTEELHAFIWIRFHTNKAGIGNINGFSHSPWYRIHFNYLQ
jgi:hypothetical protein